jgi:hypothetical protein
MAWPEKLSGVMCIGFPRELLPTLVEAIDNEHVKWIEGSSSMFAEYGHADFDYLGFRYRLHEFVEVVQSIEKIAKIDEDEETAAPVVEVDLAAQRTGKRNGPSWGTW